MTTYEITSSAHDDCMRHYDLEDGVPIEGITIDEADGTATIHSSGLKSALRTLVAIERDRQLGYAPDKLHVTPEGALQTAYDTLVALGDDPDEIIPERDRRALNLTRPATAGD